MGFTIDQQTLEDLNLLGKYKKNSIFNMFNATVTRQGELLLEQFFNNPLQDEKEIGRRTAIFSYFGSLATEFPIDRELFDGIDFYVRISSSGNLADSLLTMLQYRLRDYFSTEKLYEKITRGIRDLVNILRQMEDFVAGLPAEGSPYGQEITEMRQIFDDRHYRSIGEITAGKTSLSFAQVVKLDNIFRSVFKEKLDKLLGYICEIDVYLAVANTARERNMSYARVRPPECYSTEIEGLFHPALDNAVSNDVTIDSRKNLFFLTGANMAGKSTFMKSYGVAVYLAHMGFPVPARNMAFSIMDGMLTSINVPDDISKGYSHFYAEVLRVKRAAEEVGDSKNMLFIFDELFKGTNVKDAYDATVAVAEAFAGHRNCSFIISTHIIEVGEDLRGRCDNIQFHYFPTLMEGTTPVYPYKLQEGITSDRFGMVIINDERIIEIIRNRVKEEKQEQL